MGVDLGLKRIGLAISEGTQASSWKVITTNSFQNSVEQIINIVKIENFDKVIVGLPEGAMGRKVVKFINALKRTKIDVESTDETLSSQNATSLMVELNIPKKKRAVNDSFAAMLILQEYLDRV